MFTKHYNSGSIEDYLNDAYNTFPNNTRVKLEQDNNFTKPISVINYLEIHVKVVFTGHCPLGTYWVHSTNPKDIAVDGNEIFFFNKRIYTGDINEETELARLETAGMHILDFKVEQVIFDSNRQTDSWWS